MGAGPAGDLVVDRCLFRALRVRRRVAGEAGMHGVEVGHACMHLAVMHAPCRDACAGGCCHWRCYTSQIPPITPTLSLSAACSRLRDRCSTWRDEQVRGGVVVGSGGGIQSGGSGRLPGVRPRPRRPATAAQRPQPQHRRGDVVHAATHMHACTNANTQRPRLCVSHAQRGQLRVQPLHGRLGLGGALKGLRRSLGVAGARVARQPAQLLSLALLGTQGNLQLPRTGPGGLEVRLQPAGGPGRGSRGRARLHDACIWQWKHEEAAACPCMHAC